MKNRKKTFLTVLVSLTILFTLATPISASMIDPVFTGYICTDEQVDLSNIEIKVYSAQLIVNEEDAEASYYGETYVFSVYTDDQGVFSFTKPSQCCSVTVELSSLPAGYGISKETQFIEAQYLSKNFSLSQVEAVETEIVYNSVSPSFYNEDDERIFVEYEVVPASAENAVLSTAQATLTVELEDVEALEAYTYSGSIQTSGGSYPYSETVDLSQKTPVEKIQVLYGAGVITEETKQQLYTDLLFASDADVDMCDTVVKAQANGEIEPRLPGLEFSNDALRIKYSSYITISGIPVRLYYHSGSDDFSMTVVNQFADKFKEVYNYFVTDLGFQAPISDSGTYYSIYLIGKNDRASLQGLTVGYDSGASYIFYSYDFVYNHSDGYIGTIAHEFAHAIMFGYGMFAPDSTSAWAHEAFASMMAMVYCTDVYVAEYEQEEEGNGPRRFDESDDAISVYLQNSSASIFTSVGISYYGALLYPLYFYKYEGGWRTIRSIFAAYADSDDNIYTAINNAGYDYGEAFIASATRNIDLESFYEDFFYQENASATADWGNVSVETLSVPDNVYEAWLYPMSCHYYQVIGGSTARTFYLTIEIVDGPSDTFVLNKVLRNASGNYSIQMVERDENEYTRITVVQNNFGGEGYNLAYFIPVSTNIQSTGTAIYQLYTSYAT